MDIFELRESIDELKYTRNYIASKQLLQDLTEEASKLCDTIEVSFIF